MSVKTISRKDLQKKSRKRGGFGRSKSQALAAKAVKILKEGDLVQCNGYTPYGCDQLPDGSYGIIITIEANLFHVLSEGGIYRVHSSSLDRVQEFWDIDRRVKLGLDADVKKI